MSASFNPCHATPRQVAIRYAVTVPTIFNWLHAGIIPAKVAVGRIYRFDLDEVDKALKSRSTEADSGNRKRIGVCPENSKQGRAAQ